MRRLALVYLVHRPIWLNEVVPQSLSSWRLQGCTASAPHVPLHAGGRYGSAGTTRLTLLVVRSVHRASCVRHSLSARSKPTVVRERSNHDATTCGLSTCVALLRAVNITSIFPFCCVKTTGGATATTYCFVCTTAVLEGYLVLEDMHIKKSFLDTLELPLTLKHGIIGRFEMRIPWSSLHKDPIIVDIDRVRKQRPCGVGTVPPSRDKLSLGYDYLKSPPSSASVCSVITEPGALEA